MKNSSNGTFRKQHNLPWLSASIVVMLLSGIQCNAQQQILDAAFYYLRNGDQREWAEFPETGNKKELTVPFQSKVNTTDHTFSLRQYDVKQTWTIRINGRSIGTLSQDEKDMITYYVVPAMTLNDGENIVQINCNDPIVDDIKVGALALDPRPINNVLSESNIEINIVEDGPAFSIPGRITIINKDRVLQSITSPIPEHLAIRPGYVYTGNGKASITLPAGTYTIFAGRGFEYGIDSIRVELKPGERAQHTLKIKREVETTGWISSDTHVHTFTYSRHGDATALERAITLAGEGIELPVITDHNQNVDIIRAATEANVNSNFTLVTGNELTTKLGHFNVFETTADSPAITHNAGDWNELSKNISDKNEHNIKQAVILNHARDIHNDFRPFDPSHHISSAGTSKFGWKFPANAMEVINSGSQQSDIMVLYHDWFGMLNHGNFLTPVGSSDSHDVSRYTVGQGRTYIQYPDTDVSKIDIDKAISNFADGKVLVSMGLLTKIQVNDRYGPGDLVPGSQKIRVSVEVSGPAWVNAERVSLYANGIKIKEEKIKGGTAPGIKWQGSWELPEVTHDIFLVAIADGPGADMPYWPIEKPYQPASKTYEPRIIGSTGAVWIDVDKDGKRSSAYDYAARVISASKKDFNKMIDLLSSYDEAVTVQAVVQLWKGGVAINELMSKADKKSSSAVKAGVKRALHEISLLK